MRHINIYNTTEEYNAAKSELYTLEHFVAYNKETNEILTKDIVNITFNITPEDATINYSIDNESYDQVASNGVPIQVTYKSTLYYKISRSSYSYISGMFFANDDSTITYTLSKEANVGDIIIYKDGEFFAVNPNELTNEGTPIGIVAIPSSHNIYGDGSCGVMALNCEYKMMGTKYSSNPLTNYPNAYYINNMGEAQDWDSVQLLDSKQGAWYCCFIPSDYPEAEDNRQSLDKSRYYLNTSITNYTALGPSPYNSDGSKNDVYYMKDSQYNNALSDINGSQNTLILKDFVADQYKCEAAIYCNQYSTEGTNPGDWFLPAIGELTHLISNYSKIQISRDKIVQIYGADLIDTLGTVINSSTSVDMDNFWKVNTNNLEINSDNGYNTENQCTIPFLKLKL